LDLSRFDAGGAGAIHLIRSEQHEVARNGTLNDRTVRKLSAHRIGLAASCMNERVFSCKAALKIMHLRHFVCRACCGKVEFGQRAQAAFPDYPFA
tara:strand:- start:13 stop:297 length:285 start_codon:yes stop_codon:yes gene_type:complete